MPTAIETMHLLQKGYWTLGEETKQLTDFLLGCLIMMAASKQAPLLGAAIAVAVMLS